ADDWNADGAPGLREILEVSLRIDAKFRRSSFDLLFKKRMKNDRCSARLFHRSDVVDLLRKRRGRRHQRRPQRQAKIVRRQIHRWWVLILDRKMSMGRLVSRMAISTQTCDTQSRVCLRLVSE